MEEIYIIIYIYTKNMESVEKTPYAEHFRDEIN